MRFKRGERRDAENPQRRLEGFESLIFWGVFGNPRIFLLSLR